MARKIATKTVTILKKGSRRYVKRVIQVTIWARVDRSTSNKDAIEQASEACQEIEGTYTSGKAGACDGLMIDSNSDGVEVYFDPDSIEYMVFESGTVAPASEAPTF